MTPITHHLPVVLLLGERAASHDAVDEWLAKSRFSTREAASVFQVLEQISDFTVDDTPDVVFVHVDPLDAEIEMLERMLISSEGDLGTCVIAFSEDQTRGHSTHGVTGLHALAQRLDRLIPSSEHIN
jgi:hypothetical protein